MSGITRALWNAKVITYQGSIAGQIARTVADSLADRVSVKQWAKGDGATDDLANLTAATSAGVALTWPAGTYRITGTLTCTTPQTWYADGPVTILYDPAGGVAAAPVLDLQSFALVTGNFTVDQQANTKGYTNPTVYHANIIAGSAVLVQGDYSTIENMRVKNAWDDGIAVVQLSQSTGLAVNGKPQYWRVAGVRTTGCGVGVHTGATPGKVGAGIDVGSGSAGVVSDCVDYNSYVGFILDLGAGAQADFSNCISWYAQLDGANPANGSGYGFYAGSGDSSFTNCTSVGAALRGFWHDAPAQNIDYVNCYAYIPQKEGWWFKGGAATLSGCRVKGAGQAAANTYDAVLIDSSAGAINQLVFDGFATTGSNHRYGINTTGGNSIVAQINGGSLTGTTAPWNVAGYNVGVWMWDQAGGKNFGINRATPGFPLDVYGRGRISADVANTSFKVNVFGDSGNNGTLFIEDNATPTKRIAMGYDPVNDCGVVQAIQAGTAKKPLAINPSGGALCLGAPAPATNANDGFPQVPVMSGTPTGTPAQITGGGYAPMCVDQSGSKLWVYINGGWKSAALS